MIQDKKTYVQDCWYKAKSYCEQVESGETQTNENIRLAVKRHELDLQRSDLEWRPEAVEKVFTFFSYLYIGKNRQFILEPFQAFIILALFGLFFRGTNTRKYLYAFLFIGRANGKTTFASALQLYFMLFDGVIFPRSILISASQTNTKDTSFDTLIELITNSPALDSRLVAMKSNRILFKDPKKLGWCKTTVMDMKKLEGYNPTSCILDEIHTYKDSQKFNVLKNALGKRENSMLFLISTGGVDKNSFCSQLVSAGRNVLRGISTDDRFFYLLYELEEGDDPSDYNTWHKANPALGSLLNLKDFQDNYNTSKNIPSSLEDFYTKRLNMFVDEQSDWIPKNILLSNIKVFTDEDVKDLPCYIGLDLSETRDLTSMVCLWDGGDKYYVKPYFFFVKNESNSLRKGGVDIKQWIKEEYVIDATKNQAMDYDLIQRYIFDINKKYKVKALYPDPWHFRKFVNMPKDCKGITWTNENGESIWCVPVRPGFPNYDWPMRYIEELLFKNMMNIYPNKCMVWNFQNTVKYKDKLNGNIRPGKDEFGDAMDGVISLHNAFYGCLGVNTSAASLFFKGLEL
jgi:phage terminase large subunit-like protein